MCASIMASAGVYAEEAWDEGLTGGTSNRNSLACRRDRPRVSVCVGKRREGLGEVGQCRFLEASPATGTRGQSTREDKQKTQTQTAAVTGRMALKLRGVEGGGEGSREAL